MNLDAVCAGFTRSSGRLTERIDHHPDLFGSHPLGWSSAVEIRFVRGREANLVMEHLGNLALPAREEKLNDVRALVLVDASDELSPERDSISRSMCAWPGAMTPRS